MEFNQKEGQRFVDYGCELIAIKGEVMQQFEHLLETHCTHDP